MGHATGSAVEQHVHPPISYQKTIVCLASSYKGSGRCVAGREVLANGCGEWIRPVSERDAGELSCGEYRYESGEEPQLLDLIEISFLGAQPEDHQVENHVIDAGGRWIQKGRWTWHQLAAIQDRPASLWINRDSTKAGRFDRISREEAATVSGSLLLIRPENFTLEVGWKRLRAAFEYNGVRHNLSVTDPMVRQAYETAGRGSYPMDEVYLCVSLTEPYEHDEMCHKIVAGVMGRTIR